MLYYILLCYRLLCCAVYYYIMLYFALCCKLFCIRVLLFYDCYIVFDSILCYIMPCCTKIVLYPIMLSLIIVFMFYYRCQKYVQSVKDQFKNVMQR